MPISATLGRLIPVPARRNDENAILFSTSLGEESRPVWTYGQERASKRFPPASTFKIPNTLFALDAGAVSDEFEVCKWDGIERGF
jgi:beta-lactamase class D